jgi:membrane fusion protein, multidrug efflux system
MAVPPTNAPDDPKGFQMESAGAPTPIRTWELGSWIFGAVLTAAIVLTLSACSPSGDKAQGPRDDSVPVTTASVALSPMDRSIPVVGTLVAKDESTIGAQVEGQVENTAVDFGAHVTAGQELALIDTDSYQALARQAAATLAKAKANALNGEQNLKRVIELQQNKIASASDLDSATALAEQSRAEVKAAEAAEAIAQLNLARSHARSPFEGTVSERIANLGDYVKIGAPLFRLVNDRELKYIVQVPERYASQVKNDQVVQFEVDAWPAECFRGTVYLVSPSVNTATRAFYVAARVPNPDGKLKANTFAHGELVFERDVPTPMVPLEAVQSFAGVTKVFVIENQGARSRDVKTGRIKNGQIEVLEGLKPGESVAISGQTKLFEGAKVRIQNPEIKTASR